MSPSLNFPAKKTAAALQSCLSSAPCNWTNSSRNSFLSEPRFLSLDADKMSLLFEGMLSYSTAFRSVLPNY